MSLGGTSSTADAITACAAAKKDDAIARVGIETLNCGARGGTHNSADFHALCSIARVVNLLNIAGGKANLVAVG